MKIGIVSGRVEAVQVQLTLLNYLTLWQKEEGAHIQWEWFLEYKVEERHLLEQDILCFVRAKSLQALCLMNGCRQQGIPVTYILDDNWFCEEMAREVQYFKQCLLCSTHVFVYNRQVYDYVKAYHEKVYLFEPTVNTQHFKPIRKEEGYHIGFAGSESKKQYFAPVFSALQRLLEDRREVKLYFKGIYLPQDFRKYGDQIHEEGYDMVYTRYASAVSGWGCDMMLAPLEETPYTQGKCPNKYLEITAMGAAGIYSDTSVYRQYVRHEENGFIVAHTEASWYEMLCRLCDNKKLCEQIVSRAQQDVEKHYTPEVILPFFKAVLQQIYVERQ